MPSITGGLSACMATAQRGGWSRGGRAESAPGRTCCGACSARDSPRMRERPACALPREECERRPTTDFVVRVRTGAKRLQVSGWRSGTAPALRLHRRMRRVIPQPFEAEAVLVLGHRRGARLCRPWRIDVMPCTSWITTIDGEISPKIVVTSTAGDLRRSRRDLRQLQLRAPDLVCMRVEVHVDRSHPDSDLDVGLERDVDGGPSRVESSPA